MIAKDQMMYEGGSNQYEKQKKVVQGFKYKLIMICIGYIILGLELPNTISLENININHKT